MVFKTRVCKECGASFVPLETEKVCLRCNHNKVNDAIEEFEERNRKNKKFLKGGN